MGKIYINVQKEFCDECSLALRRFIGKLNGVNNIETESGQIVVDYDSSKILESDIIKITKESIEKLGYKISD
jgi:copper chaperone CopZ